MVTSVRMRSKEWCCMESRHVWSEKMQSWSGKKGLTAPFEGIRCLSSEEMARAGRGPKVVWEMSD